MFTKVVGNPNSPKWTRDIDVEWEVINSRCRLGLIWKESFGFFSVKGDPNEPKSIA